MPNHPPEPHSADFTTFMRAYQDMVFSTAARLTGNDATAADIAQDVFISAYERFDTLQGSPTAGGWLKTVARHKALNHLNRYRNRWRFFSELAARRGAGRGDVGRSADAYGVGEPLDWQVPDTVLAELGIEERRALIDDALRRLPDHQRLPLVLYHFEDLSYDEIAAALHVSLAKVKTDINRARVALLAILARAGATPDLLEA